MDFKLIRKRKENVVPEWELTRTFGTFTEIRVRERTHIHSNCQQSLMRQVFPHARIIDVSDPDGVIR